MVLNYPDLTRFARSNRAQTIGTLSKLLGLTPTVPLGLTDAIRLGAGPS